MKLTPLVAVLTALLLAACTPVSRGVQQLQAQYLLQYPALIPGYLVELLPLPGEQRSQLTEICFVILEGELWEEGDPKGDIRYEGIEVVLDSERLIPSVKMQVGSNHGKFDKQGNYVGNYGGPTYVCANKPMKAGIHLVTVKVGARSGRSFLYSWAFSTSADAPAE